MWCATLRAHAHRPMPVTRQRVFHAAVALIALAALAAAPALATEVEDRNQTSETPSDAVEAGEGEIAGKWFWKGWWGWGSGYAYNYWYTPYYNSYCRYWNYGYGYKGYGAYKAAASGTVETRKKVTAADATARAAEVRATLEGLTETTRGVAAGEPSKSESGATGERLAVDARARLKKRASAERARVAAGCGDWLGVAQESLAAAPATVAVVDDACCWPSRCALAASTGCEDEGRACCVPDSRRVEGCE